MPGTPAARPRRARPRRPAASAARPPRRRRRARRSRRARPPRAPPRPAAAGRGRLPAARPAPARRGLPRSRRKRVRNGDAACAETGHRRLLPAIRSQRSRRARAAGPARIGLGWGRPRLQLRGQQLGDLQRLPHVAERGRARHAHRAARGAALHRHARCHLARERLRPGGREKSRTLRTSYCNHRAQTCSWSPAVRSRTKWAPVRAALCRQLGVPRPAAAGHAQRSGALTPACSPCSWHSGHALHCHLLACDISAAGQRESGCMLSCVRTAQVPR
jgi:hypothetical protein